MNHLYCPMSAHILHPILLNGYMAIHCTGNTNLCNCLSIVGHKDYIVAAYSCKYIFMCICEYIFMYAFWAQSLDEFLEEKLLKQSMCDFKFDRYGQVVLIKVGDNLEYSKTMCFPVSFLIIRMGP